MLDGDALKAGQFCSGRLVSSLILIKPAILSVLCFGKCLRHYAALQSYIKPLQTVLQATERFRGCRPIKWNRKKKLTYKNLSHPLVCFRRAFFFLICCYWLVPPPALQQFCECNWKCRAASVGYLLWRARISELDQYKQLRDFWFLGFSLAVCFLRAEPHPQVWMPCSLGRTLPSKKTAGSTKGAVGVVTILKDPIWTALVADATLPLSDMDWGGRKGQIGESRTWQG